MMLAGILERTVNAISRVVSSIRLYLPLLLLGASATASAAEQVVRYWCDVPGMDGGQCTTNRITIILPSLSLGGITVTGSGPLWFGQLNGIGVVGGVADGAIDSGESVTFSFENGPVSGVSMRIPGGRTANVVTVDVFGIGGSFVGQFSQNFAAGTFDVSSIAGFAEITAFQVSVTHPTKISHVAYLPPPEQQLEDLAGLVLEVNLSSGLSNALDTKLDTALTALDDANDKNDVATVNSLYAFCSNVSAQRGKKVSEADADQLITDANATIRALDPFASPCE
jgi:hypothetical protein